MNKQFNEQSDEIKLLRDEKYDLRQIIEMNRVIKLNF